MGLSGGPREWWAAAVVLAGCSEYNVGAAARPERPPAEEEEVVAPAPPATVPEEEPDDVPVAQAPVYANTSTSLFEIDPATGDLRRRGAFAVADGTAVTGMVDIAIDLDGHMYGGTERAIYQVDPETAEVKRVCDVSTPPYALAFTSDGVLFAGTESELTALDLVSCTARPLVRGGEYETSGDLVGLPDGYLYWTVIDTNRSDALVRVDPDTGDTRWIGQVGAAGLYGLGYDEDALYGFSADGSIVRIDPGDASTALVHEDGTAWWGATTNPVVW